MGYNGAGGLRPRNQSKDPTIVQFENGKYAIRKCIHKWRYGNTWYFLDLKREHKYWWPKDSEYFVDCLADTTEGFDEAMRLLDVKHHAKLVEEREAKDMGKAVKSGSCTISTSTNKEVPSRREGMSETMSKFKFPTFFNGKWFTD